PLYGDRLRLDLAADLPDFPFDWDRIRRVLINLIENAIQADPKDNPVQVRTSLLGNRITLMVEDKGAGIPPAELGKIFEPYFSTKSGGTGLGLAITRLIVEEHNGRISVNSTVGEGTRFRIEFPKT
ncbi:MAG: sensor histidine kinase, partial [Anaerolineales bacterium]